ncbi:MAG: Asp23/Gls24 family envelope stress response protein [Peptococcaceae bacterium]|nr:Asp23/Gls24 family envelope stress response protein [Peptococcaceae bacterium]
MAEDKRLENGQGQIRSTDFGTIRVDDEVAASAAAIAVASIEGIVDTFGTANEGFIGSMTDGFSGMLGKKPGIRGVRVDYKNDGFYFVINIKVKYGYAIADLASDIQRKVKQDVEQMTGTKVRAVDIFVQDIDFSTINETDMGDQYA